MQIGSDDLYMSAAQRKAAGVATRLDPRSLDPEYFDLIARLKTARACDRIELPVNASSASLCGVESMRVLLAGFGVAAPCAFAARA